MPVGTAVPMVSARSTGPGGMLNLTAVFRGNPSASHRFLARSSQPP
ncbi:MAG: hypothetical protein NTW21_08500 [Verrucomicrobia bacterium]|nr:hypothetical protein [Verrucomicrobiota bacterium]